VTAATEKAQDSLDKHKIKVKHTQNIQRIEHEMAKEDTEEKIQKRILILCVDRDGDLGAKAEVKTPVVGRKENLEAAVTLALSDPEEPDANAMFEAVRTYDRLKGEGKPEETFEIATISGSELLGVGADRKIVAELSGLLETFAATEIILVVDGYSDEAVLPLVQSRVPVSSVSRIVVKHSESIEETAALFSRYLKMIVENPRYARFILGVPGLLFLIAAVLSFFNLLSIFWVVFVLVLSLIMVVKGFGADKTVRNFYNWTKEYSPPPLRVQISNFAAIVGALCIVLGVYLGWTSAAPEFASHSDVWVSFLPQIAGFFIKDATTLIIVGLSVTLLGRAIRWYLEHDPRLLRNVALMISVAWSRQILDATADLLKNESDKSIVMNTLIFYVIIGILIGIASVLVIFVVHRSSKGFFKETKEQVEEFGEG
jgi:putative membrane protein